MNNVFCYINLQIDILILITNLLKYFIEVLKNFFSLKKIIFEASSRLFFINNSVISLEI